MRSSVAASTASTQQASTRTIRPVYRTVFPARTDRGLLNRRRRPRSSQASLCFDSCPSLNFSSCKGLDLVLDGSGSLDEDDVPESEFPLRLVAIFVERAPSRSIFCGLIQY